MYFDPVAGSDQALLITEQLLVFATVVGSVGALPSFIEFMTERRKRRERIDLSLEDEPVVNLRPRLAGMDELLRSIEERREIPEDAQRMFASVAEFYLSEARRRGFTLAGLSDQEFCARVLEGAMNPAEIEDIVVLCETTALFRRRTRQSERLVITPEILETAIERVIVG